MDRNSERTTHFGYREVPVAEKTRLVHQVFESVADNYDLMNDLMSLGVHRFWKRHFVATSGIGRGDRVLDLAGGTGDIAALLSRKVGGSGEVVLSDINPAMLAVGRRRLDLEDVEAGTRDGSGTQRHIQGRAVDQRAPARVDQDRLGPHTREPGSRSPCR